MTYEIQFYIGIILLILFSVIIFMLLTYISPKSLMEPKKIFNAKWTDDIDLSKDETDNTAIVVVNNNEKHESGLEVDAVKPKVVLHDWIIDGCDFKEQSGLIAVLRGTDLDKGNDKEAKNITKMLRYIILKDADRKTKFMSPYVVDGHIIVSTLIRRYEDNPHWVEHIILAGFIISKHHDCNYARAFWGKTAYETNKGIKCIIKKNKNISRYVEIYSRGYL